MNEEWRCCALRWSEDYGKHIHCENLALSGCGIYVVGGSYAAYEFSVFPLLLYCHRDQGVDL